MNYSIIETLAPYLTADQKEVVVRVGEGEDGEPAIVAIDFLSVLGYKDQNRARDRLNKITKKMGAGYVTTVSMDTAGGRQKLKALTIYGLNALIMDASIDHPAINPIREKVLKEIMPAVFGKGFFVDARLAAMAPGAVADLEVASKDWIAERRALLGKVEELREENAVLEQQNGIVRDRSAAVAEEVHKLICDPKIASLALKADHKGRADAAEAAKVYLENYHLLHSRALSALRTEYNQADGDMEGFYLKAGKILKTVDKSEHDRKTNEFWSPPALGDFTR